MTLVFAKACFGRIPYAKSACAKSTWTAALHGARRRTTTVCGSGVVSAATRSYESLEPTPFAGSKMARYVNATSADVSGTPSAKRTPGRKWYVMRRPSAEMSPFAREGMRVTRIGTNRLRSSSPTSV
jgi:hypothetical protein